MVTTADLSRLRIERETSNDSPVKRRMLIAGLGALLVIALIAFLLTRENAVEVSVATAAMRGGGAGNAGLTANGYVVARTKASVSSKVAGRLAFLAVEEGDPVRAGAVLARLEAAEYEAAVRQATAEMHAADAARLESEAAVRQAVRAHDRAKSLAANSLISPQAVEDAETQVEVVTARLSSTTARALAAREALATAQASLENTRIRAPFSGTVLRKDAEVGEVVAPAVAGGGLTRGAVVTLADLSTLEVEVDVNEAYISGIQHEQPADIVLDAYPSVTFAGHVRKIVPTADRQKATVLVRVAIDSRDPRILPEMGARVVFREATDSAATATPAVTRVFVPTDAVRSIGGETVVFVVMDEHVQRRVIEAAPVSGGEREVRRGLSGGETLVVDAPANLADGARVRISEKPKQRSE